MKKRNDLFNILTPHHWMDRLVVRGENIFCNMLINDLVILYQNGINIFEV